MLLELQCDDLYQTSSRSVHSNHTDQRDLTEVNAVLVELVQHLHEVINVHGSCT